MQNQLREYIQLQTGPWYFGGDGGSIFASILWMSCVLGFTSCARTGQTEAVSMQENLKGNKMNATEAPKQHTYNALRMEQMSIHW